MVEQKVRKRIKNIGKERYPLELLKLTIPQPAPDKAVVILLTIPSDEIPYMAQDEYRGIDCEPSSTWSYGDICSLVPALESKSTGGRTISWLIQALC